MDRVTHYQILREFLGELGRPQETPDRGVEVDDPQPAPASSGLDSGCVIWLLTPKAGREWYVEPSDIGEAAPTAGLTQTSTSGVAADWTATRLVTPKRRR